MTRHDRNSLRELAVAISRGDHPVEELAVRPGRVTARADIDSQHVVVKLWNLRDARSTIRRALRRTKGRCEREALQRLHAASAAVPEPLAFFQLRERGARRHEALVVEDLAPCHSLHRHLHACTKRLDEAEVRRLDEQLIGLTAEMIAAGVYDSDHRLANFLVREKDGRVFRVDFENARRLRPGPRRDRALGVMLGALVSSYAWAVRFEPSLTPRFVEGLLEAAPPGERALRHAQAAAERDLRRSFGGSGFEPPRLEQRWVNAISPPISAPNSP